MEIKIRRVMCVWCGLSIQYPTDATKPEVYEIMKKHDLTCPEHPLQKRIVTLIAACRRALNALDRNIGDKPEAKDVRDYKLIQSAIMGDK